MGSRRAVAGMVVASFLVGAGCSEAPERVQMRAYLTDLRPVLYENRLLAEQVLRQGAAVYNEDSSPDEVMDAWDGTVVPLAQHVHDLAAGIEPPDTVSPDHRALVSLLDRRQRAYRGLSDAFHLAQEDAFVDAQREVNKVTLEEDRWVRTFNQRLQIMRLRSLDLVP